MFLSGVGSSGFDYERQQASGIGRDDRGFSTLVLGNVREEL